MMETEINVEMDHFPVERVNWPLPADEVADDTNTNQKEQLSGVEGLIILSHLAGCTNEYLGEKPLLAE